MDTEIKFETALESVERIVAELERGQTPLGDSLAKYEEAVRLLGQCQGLIERTERSVALLTGVDENGEPVTSPFDARATVPAAETATTVVAAPAPKEKKTRKSASVPPAAPTTAPAAEATFYSDIEPPF